MRRVFVGLGSNLGDRAGYLRAAVRALCRGPGLEVVAVSPVYETDPVEVEGEQPAYLNCVVELECGLGPLELLRYCQGVEAALGREGKGEKAPRTLDLDILLFGEERLEYPELTVPHPGVGRAFNLRCLADLDPGLYIPGRGSVSGLLGGADLEGVRASGEVLKPC
ncbi:2-amino-4-hydroxy-6- hydroxymethyldihydropteridine pyrophosphokinase [Rubrobacter xylanophilus DSM 9941]|uniref:2-amino-4-hydroxy-6- hydroxymethyldihydropteridine diphosphokinase n=1 Tax=Rubrobacter xylanophilus TaxID=49319 RepID=UPI001C63D5C8|nr:2-amino-4-hydroxy-6-hydroxymethyldihydropteridine diphosphokinase [Rubrobacter xylanophilus]QYJ15342.1 2-amino-4-hydroxy-6- hydroxymethyldihydropteridine pyrophosphokinase [Rubrobacter xylanophilus DSM 9941]